MKNKLPTNTTKFLSLMLEEKIQKNKSDDIILFKKSYIKKFKNLNESDCSKYFGYLDSGKPLAMYIPPECIKLHSERKEKLKKEEEMYGSPGFKKSSDPSKYTIPHSFGGHPSGGGGIGGPPPDEDSDEALGFLGLLGAAGSSTAGRGLNKLISRGLMRSLPSWIPKKAAIAKKVGEGLSDISGSSYIDVNLDDMIFQNLKNIVSGAGSPFHKLQIPVHKDDPYDYWRRRSIADGASYI
jgi:hypothetical protein